MSQLGKQRGSDERAGVRCAPVIGESGRRDRPADRDADPVEVAVTYVAVHRQVEDVLDEEARLVRLVIGRGRPVGEDDTQLRHSVVRLDAETVEGGRRRPRVLLADGNRTKYNCG